MLNLSEHEGVWYELWVYFSNQRLGVGLGLGEINHLAIEAGLKRKGYRGYQLDRTMDVILGIDKIYREAANQSQENKNQRGNKPPASEGVRTLVEQRKGEMERGSKAV